MVLIFFENFELCHWGVKKHFHMNLTGTVWFKDTQSQVLNIDFKRELELSSLRIKVLKNTS